MFLWGRIRDAPFFAGQKAAAGGGARCGAAFLRQNLAIFIKKTHIDKIKIVENAEAAPTPRPEKSYVYIEKIKKEKKYFFYFYFSI